MTVYSKKMRLRRFMRAFAHLENRKWPLFWGIPLLLGDCKSYRTITRGGHIEAYTKCGPEFLGLLQPSRVFSYPRWELFALMKSIIFVIFHPVHVLDFPSQWMNYCRGSSNVDFPLRKVIDILFFLPLICNHYVVSGCSTFLL